MAKHYIGDALAEMKKIKPRPDGTTDGSTWPRFAVVDGNRNLGDMITMLVVAVQQLVERIETLEKKK